MTLRIKCRPYKVGPGHPPKEFQFKPGQSGNPNGRPANSRTMYSLMKEEFGRMVTVSDGKQKSEIAAKQALARKWLHDALRGDTKASEIVLKFLTREMDSDHTSLPI